MIENKECPVCGSKDIGKGKQYAQGKMFPIDNLISLGSEVIAEICTNCGHILSMKVTKPEKFK
ncbi:MAG: transcription initiation factor TFIIIB [Marinisporobacter sp.]|jgi:predicted RNA-binding Zn-ribbon protein involved in translation (DUF1610 family)|nr:transcription initiation factor TFIIIB [Marinisporobacter sp.]